MVFVRPGLNMLYGHFPCAAGDCEHSICALSGVDPPQVVFFVEKIPFDEFPWWLSFFRLPECACGGPVVTHFLIDGTSSRFEQLGCRFREPRSSMIDSRSVHVLTIIGSMVMIVTVIEQKPARPCGVHEDSRGSSRWNAPITTARSESTLGNDGGVTLRWTRRRVVLYCPATHGSNSGFGRALPAT